MSSIKSISLILLFLAIAWLPVVSQWDQRNNEPPPSSTADPQIAPNRQGLSPVLQANFPIHMPTYDGVEQLLLLSNRWVIVVTSNLEDVASEIHKLSGIDFLGAQQRWLESKQALRHDWYLRRNTIEALINKYGIQARINAGELELDRSSYYSISSQQDQHYQNPVHPSQVTRYIVCVGGERVVGFDIDYAHYSYLELPQPLVQGNTYTIALENGKKVSFLYDEYRTISRSIKVNQVGYLPNVPHKYAYLSGYLQELGPLDFSFAKTFSVVDATTGQTVLTRPIVNRASNPYFTYPEWKVNEWNQAHAKNPDLPPLDPLGPMTGEDTYELDLSELTRPGVYFLTIPEVGRSWPFRVGADVYGEAFYTAMRGMYAQRCGIALTSDYSAWTRMKCHDWPAYESEYVSTDFYMENPHADPFDVIGATLDLTKATPGPVHGWHDAADWDKNSWHMTNVFALLTLYEMFPNKFRDGQLHIPESGNGIPDILDEAEFGLQVWKKSMTPEGGVAGIWETSTHPSIDNPEYQYAYGRRARWLSLLYATAAAQYAHLVKPFQASKASLYESDALLAYQFGTQPANSLGTVTIHARHNRGQGEPYSVTWTEEERYNWPYLASAKMRLFLLTNDQSYLDGVGELLQKMEPRPERWRENYWDYFSFLYLGMFSPALHDKIPLTIIREWDGWFDKQAQELAQLSEGDPYRRSKDRYVGGRLAWGAGCVTNQAKWLLLAHHLTRKSSYLEAALFNADYQLGTNPQGMVWTTSLGFVYPIQIQHTISEEDNILDPFPGITIYGPTNNGYRMISSIWELRDSSGNQARFLSPRYWKEDGDVVLPPELRRYMTHPHLLVDQNEFTIHETMASSLFVFGYLMNEDWMPSEPLKNRKPREDHLLFGRWLMP